MDWPPWIETVTWVSHVFMIFNSSVNFYIYCAKHFHSVRQIRFLHSGGGGGGGGDEETNNQTTIAAPRKNSEARNGAGSSNRSFGCSTVTTTILVKEDQGMIEMSSLLNQADTIATSEARIETSSFVNEDGQS